jgi:hypothetical protein
MSTRPRVGIRNPSLLLLVPVALDYVWIYLNPPPSHPVNPFFLYLVVFGIGVFLLSHLLVPAAVRLRQRFGAKIVFAGLGFALAMIEETVAYVTGSGIFQDNHHPLVFGLIQAGLPLFLWSLGVLLVLQRFTYTSTQLFVLVGLSGWLCEAVLGGILFTAPALIIAVIPVVAYSYFVLIYLPYRAIDDLLQKKSWTFWGGSAMLAVPTAFWFLGGIAGFFLSRGVA